MFDYSGKVVRRFGSKGSGRGQFIYPNGVAIDSAGNYLVACGAHRVQVFKPDATFITAWGEEHDPFGDASKSFVFKPHCVEVDGAGRILVGDKRAHVLVFGFEA